MSIVKILAFFKLFKERIQLLPSVSFKNSSRILWRSSWNVSQNNEWEFRFCCLMEMVFFKMYSKKNCITSLFSGLYFVDAECNFFSKLYIPWNFFKCSNTYLLPILGWMNGFTLRQTAFKYYVIMGKKIKIGNQILKIMNMYFLNCTTCNISFRCSVR